MLFQTWIALEPKSQIKMVLFFHGFSLGQVAVEYTFYFKNKALSLTILFSDV